MSRDPAEATSARHQASAGTTAPTGAESRPAGRRATHEVLNQPPPLQDTASFRDDAMLVDALTALSPDADLGALGGIGDLAGSSRILQLGSEANRNPPQLHTHDRYGNRIDEVSFHPAWHELMTTSVGAGLHAAAWADPEPGAHARRAAGFMLMSQAEPGHCCPISMTYAIVPALRTDPDVGQAWIPGLQSTEYDFGLRAPREKAGLIAGMAMTEKQGGSDVRANTTTATPTAEDGWYVLQGHKWFCSAPMSDLFLVLAQTPEGLSCFAVPRVLDDGTRNPFEIQRLKDKLGNRSNASSEIEFDGTMARLLGEPGRGVRTIVEMVSATRLDCVLGSTALMRRALAEAVWHAEHRAAFGKTLVEQPLMRTVLADLALEVEAATWLGIRLAAAVDAETSQGSEADRALRRIALPMSKYLVCKRAPGMVFEAMECLGGMGYVEDSGLPLLYREAPVNSIWEGSGSVNALDLLRAVARSPESLDAWLVEVGSVRGEHRGYDLALTDVLDLLARGADELTPLARVLSERMALLLQASLLLRFAPDDVASTFCETRLPATGERGAGLTFGATDLGGAGTSPAVQDAIISRASLA